MKDTYLLSCEKNLSGIAPGTFQIHQYPDDTRFLCHFTDSFSTKTEGKGRIQVYSLFPGIQLAFHQYLADQVHFQHPAQHSTLEINYCHRGRIGWNMHHHISVYLGSGDLCLHTLDCCADSQMTLPLGYYEGISITIDPALLGTKLPEILREADWNPDMLIQTFCGDGHPFALPAAPQLDSILGILYDLPEALRLPYYKLKTQELLLYLSQMDPRATTHLPPYVSQQTELIREIHSFLMAHLDKRFTIEELSKKYLINSASLKTLFKAVYGLPIATYMKKCRMEAAMKLLRETDRQIADIASAVGYESQGKFTRAFKEESGMTPREYRKIQTSAEGSCS